VLNQAGRHAGLTANACSGVGKNEFVLFHSSSLRLQFGKEPALIDYSVVSEFETHALTKALSETTGRKTGTLLAHASSSFAGEVKDKPTGPRPSN
jgi:hypothetical protein